MLGRLAAGGPNTANARGVSPAHTLTIWIKRLEATLAAIDRIHVEKDHVAAPAVDHREEEKVRVKVRRVEVDLVVHAQEAGLDHPMALADQAAPGTHAAPGALEDRRDVEEDLAEKVRETLEANSGMANHATANRLEVPTALDDRVDQVDRVVRVDLTDLSYLPKAKS